MLSTESSAAATSTNQEQTLQTTDISQNTSDVSTLEGRVATNERDISQNKADISQNEYDISQNKVTINLLNATGFYGTLRLVNNSSHAIGYNITNIGIDILNANSTRDFTIDDANKMFEIYVDNIENTVDDDGDGINDPILLNGVNAQLNAQSLKSYIIIPDNLNEQSTITLTVTDR